MIAEWYASFYDVFLYMDWIAETISTYKYSIYNRLVNSFRGPLLETLHFVTDSPLSSSGDVFRQLTTSF